MTQFEQDLLAIQNELQLVMNHVRQFKARLNKLPPPIVMPVVHEIPYAYCKLGATFPFLQNNETRIESLPTSHRIIRSLIEFGGAATLKDLAELTVKDILKIKNFGRKSLHELLFVLTTYQEQFARTKRDQTNP